MKRLLMFLYLVLVASEAKPRTGWKQRIRKLVPDSLLTFAESPYEPPKPPRRLPVKAEATGGSDFVLTSAPTTPTPEPQHKKVVEVIPKTLVEIEAEVAITLQLPQRTTPQGIAAFGNDRFDTPIGRTLTREFYRRDPGHLPRAVVRHLPIEDVLRDMIQRRSDGSHPTSPRRRGTDKKGRPTPKRPRRNHGH